MKALDYIIIAVIALCVAAVIIFLIRRKKRGGNFCGSCGGDCENCPFNKKER